VAVSSGILQRRSHRFRSPGKIQHPLTCEFSYNGNDNDEVAVNQDKPNSPDAKLAERQKEPAIAPEGNEIEEFFQRLPGNFRWPKPNAEAVAAAAEAIHRLSGGAAGDVATSGDAHEPGNACPACGGLLPPGARFCALCGIPAQPVAGDAAAPSRPAAGQHHFHHHYHHFVPGAVSGDAAAPGAPSAGTDTSALRGRAPGVRASGSVGTSPGTSIGTTTGATTGGRAEAGARQIVQDWAQACNSRHIDDLLELYATDATLIRSSVAPVRSLPAIREFLVSMLEAGLGDVEMESLRLEVMGDIALDLGRCKMLVPVAMGKRREERGKYLVVLVRQPAGNWKILADCWSADLAVSAPTESAPRKGGDSVPPLRKNR
jgi:ketosteroid isomerase-like protein